MAYKDFMKYKDLSPEKKIAAREAARWRYANRSESALQRYKIRQERKLERDKEAQKALDEQRIALAAGSKAVVLSGQKIRRRKDGRWAARQMWKLRKERKDLMASAVSCAICGVTGKRLFADHCHLTGKLRGALCGRCNTGIGMFDDDVEVMRRALAYVWEWDRGAAMFTSC